MRLTLRTLLAYMDDILDPQDQSDLAKQVEESEAATELIHRTRDATRRLRLGAPPVIGEGMDLDPNYVAEYLDNTLASEKMTDYQQVCLDSEVHLAEVAACHHILTMVLGEPAEVDSGMRQRMYDMPEHKEEWLQKRVGGIRVDGPHASGAATGKEAEAELATAGNAASNAASNVVAKGAANDAAKADRVPDYLRASERSIAGRWVAAVAALLLVTTMSYLAFQPGGWLRPAEIVVDNGGGDLGIEAPLVGVVDPAAVDPVEGAGLPLEPTTELKPFAELPSVETPDELPSAESPSAEEPALAPAVETAVETTPPVENVLEPEPSIPEGAAGEPAVELPPVAEGEEVEPGVEEPGVDVAAAEGEALATADTPAGVVDPLGAAEGLREGGVTPAVAPAAAVSLGTLVSSKQVLLRYDEKQGEWRRLPPRSSILSGGRFLSLPTYRPALALRLGLRVEFSDAAMLRIDNAPVADGVGLRMEVTYGRFLLQNTGSNAVAIGLVLGGELVEVELGPTAVLGVDVRRPFTPGLEVEKSGSQMAAHFYAPVGKVVWGSGESSLQVAEPSQWTWESLRAGKPIESLIDKVAWLNGQSLDYLEQNISRKMEESLSGDRPARQQLLELFENSRRREEKSLAALSSTHVGQFVPFVVALADTQQQSNWDKHIAQLREAMARNPEAAQQVRETLVEQRGAEVADDLLELLRGYTPQQVGSNLAEVQEGVTRKLIDWLDHDRLEYRVLAFYNLRQIYGGKSLNYNPVNTEAKRRERAIRTWRQRLANNDLKPVGPTE